MTCAYISGIRTYGSGGYAEARWNTKRRASEVLDSMTFYQTASVATIAAL